MKDEYYRKLNVLNQDWFSSNVKAYHEWCVGVMNLLYDNLQSGDKINIIIDQGINKRPELMPYSEENGGYVKLNCSVNAVIHFDMNIDGIAFECGLNGTAVYNRYLWDEIIEVVVTNNDQIVVGHHLKPEEVKYVTDLVLRQLSHFEDSSAGVHNVDNVVKVDFGRPIPN